MRIVNWNCCRGKHDVKLPPLLRLRPQLAIIQETPEPKTDLATGQLWHGTNRNQGLLVLTFGPWRLEPAGQLHSEPRFFLPAQVIGPGERFNLLAVWVKPGPRHPPYVTALTEGLTRHREFISSAPTLIIGDLNAYWHSDRDPYRQYGLVSAYHSYYRSAVRSERHPTYYFYWRRSLPYHFDYCLVPRSWRRRIRRVRVGGYDQWTGARLSDHCPLIVDLTDRRTAGHRDGSIPGCS